MLAFKNQEGDNMNIVFWGAIVLIVVAVLFALRPTFEGVGNAVLELLDDTKSEIRGDDSENKQ